MRGYYRANGILNICNQLRSRNIEEGRFLVPLNSHVWAIS